MLKNVMVEDFSRDDPGVFQFYQSFGTHFVFFGNPFVFWDIWGIFGEYFWGNIFGGYLGFWGYLGDIWHLLVPRSFRSFFGSSRIDRSPLEELSFVAGLLFKMMVDG